jgi:hypothetical protein
MGPQGRRAGGTGSPSTDAGLDNRGWHARWKVSAVGRMCALAAGSPAGHDDADDMFVFLIYF